MFKKNEKIIICIGVILFVVGMVNPMNPKADNFLFQQVFGSNIAWSTLLCVCGLIILLVRVVLAEDISWWLQSRKKKKPESNEGRVKKIRYGYKKTSKNKGLKLVVQFVLLVFILLTLSFSLSTISD